MARVNTRSSWRALPLALVAAMLVAGCSMPRGAALQREVLRGTDSETSDVQVFAVSRETLAELNAWPQDDAARRIHWVTTGASPAARMIRPGDQMTISIWDSQPDSLLTTHEQRVVTMQNVPISASGHVFVPYVGELRVSGMATEQARREIQDRLTPIVPDAQVQLIVTPGGSNTIDVVTGVVHPGRVELAEISPTILSVLAETGGISNALRNPLVRLNRAGQAYTIPAADLFSDPANDIQLRGGDRILVEEDDRTYIALGAAGRQHVVEFEREEINTLDALATIGGLAESRADLQGVMVLRTYPASAVRATGPAPRHEQVVFTFDLASADGLFAAQQFLIHPDDVVLATESVMPMIANSMTLLRNAAATINVFRN